MHHDSQTDPTTSHALPPEHHARALALYHDLLALRDQGVKLALVHIERELGLSAVGHRRRVGGQDGDSANSS